MNADYYIKQLQLQPHPEGGFYRQTYKSAEEVLHHALPARFTGNRSFSTAIYYLLQQGDFSAFHRIKSDECWHFYAGKTLLVHSIDMAGNYSCARLGTALDEGEMFQFVVPEGAWFAAEPASGSEYVLAGCTVAPGFDFSDFEMARQAALVKQFPIHCTIINKLTRC